MVDKHTDLREANKFDEGPGPLLHEGAVLLPVGQFGVSLLVPGGERDGDAHCGFVWRGC